jgi:hypothetical protein
MRSLRKSLIISSIACLAVGLAASAYAKGQVRHHLRPVHARAHLKAPAPPYVYGYVPDYAYYVPTRVFRCYPARQMVEDQVGLVVGYVPLGPCG